MQFIYLCLFCHGALSQEGPPGTQLTWPCFRLLAKTRLLSLCISRPQKFKARYHWYIFLARWCYILCFFLHFVKYTTSFEKFQSTMYISNYWPYIFETRIVIGARRDVTREGESSKGLVSLTSKNNTFLCHCYKQYCSECISPASSWGLWMISKIQCCVYESSRRHTSQWWQGGRHRAEASGVIWSKTGTWTQQPKWNYSWPTTRSSVSHALPRLSQEDSSQGALMPCVVSLLALSAANILPASLRQI